MRPLLTGEKLSACEICAKTFSSENNLKMHMKSHAGWRPCFWRKCWQMQMMCKSFLMSEEFEGPCCHYLLKKGLLHVNYVLKRFLVERPYFWRKCWHMQMLCKSFLMSEEFEGPRGHYFLEKGFLNVKYVLKSFLVDTTWRCTWKPTLSESLPNADIEEIVTNISSKPQSWRHISFSTAERRVKSVTPHKRNAHGHVNNVLR